MIGTVLGILTFGVALYAYMVRDPELNELLCSMEDPCFGSLLNAVAVARNAERARQIADLLSSEEEAELVAYIHSLSARVAQTARQYECNANGSTSLPSLMDSYLDLRDAVHTLARASAPSMVDKLQTAFYI